MFGRFDVPAQPALVIVDTDGTVQQFLGAVESDTLDGLLTDVTA